MLRHGCILAVALGLAGLAASCGNTTTHGSALAEKNCAIESEDPGAKVFPSIDEWPGGPLYVNITTGGEGEAVEPLPLCPPGQRTCPEFEAALEMQAERNYSSQVCVSRAIQALGGSDVQIVGSKIVSATMTREQALELARRRDVRAVGWSGDGMVVES